MILLILVLLILLIVLVVLFSCTTNTENYNPWNNDFKLSSIALSKKNPPYRMPIITSVTHRL